LELTDALRIKDITEQKMKILEIKVLKGPNYWSCYRTNLIEMKLDLYFYENFPTNKIDGFPDRLMALMPSLFTHRCSEGREGGFLFRLQKGTWLGHVVEHVALELQTLAGMNCGFGRTRSTDKTGVYNVVFTYLIENAGIYAARAAVSLVTAVAEGRSYDISADIAALEKIYYSEKLGPSTESIVNEALKRDIPYRRLDDHSLVMFGQGKNQKLIRATMADSTSSIAVELVQNKQTAKRILGEAFIPVPDGTIVRNETELNAAIDKYGFPLAIKPVNGNHGRGITTDILSKEQALDALILAKSISRDVIVERFISGYDYRMLVINFKLVAVAKRTPAMITGDGVSTIMQLIDRVNQDPRRGDGHEKVLTAIKIDQNTQSILIANDLTLHSVLHQGRMLFLKDTANLSSGGTAEDVTHLVHPQNRILAERTARLMNLDICGIDVITQDMAVPITSLNGAVLEVNAAPGFRMHQFPTEGKAQNVAGAVVDMLYPEGSVSRIPITAITGTNGKTTTVRLLAHLAMTAGHSVGCTTTEGIYINNNVIVHGDCSGPSSAKAVLRDPVVDYAVLECARGGILRSGLGFDKCDISIVTNVSEDHLGIKGINTIQQLARVKGVVPESTKADGYAILNADDNIVYRMARNLTCKVALFSLNAKSKRLARHCSAGGLAATVEDGWLVLNNGKNTTKLVEVTDIPITLEGKSDCMVQNALASVLAAVTSNFSLPSIIEGLKSFVLSTELNPGRMNIFQFDRFKVILDYAHNVAGFKELQKFMDKQQASVKTGIIGATGDRREQDIVSLGEVAAEIFDEIIIRHDRNNRGRSSGDLTALLLEGIKKNHPAKPVRVISDEIEALQHAMDHAQNDALIFITGDNISSVIEFLSKAKSAENITFAKYGT
jgi:cyanophycin synthetase